MGHYSKGRQFTGWFCPVNVSSKATETGKTHFLNPPRRKIWLSECRAWETAERATCSAPAAANQRTAPHPGRCSWGNRHSWHFHRCFQHTQGKAFGAITPRLLFLLCLRSAPRMLAASGRSGSGPGTSAPQGNGHRLSARLEFLSPAWE